MKTKVDIRALKSKHRLELVMQEAGERFGVDKSNPDQWYSKSTPGLTVDIHRQIYEIYKPGMETESGDLFKWLQRRYSWTFGMAIKFLQNRTPDPKQKVQPIKAERKTLPARKDEDKNKPLDKWQEEALRISERIRPYFSWSWIDLVVHVPETRIEPTHTPEITHCGRCEKKIKWNFEKTLSRVDAQGTACWKSEYNGPIPVTAYSIKRRMRVSSYGLEGSKELKAVFEEAKVSEALQKKIVCAIGNSLDSLITETGALFVEEEDGVVCEKCAWDEFSFQRALVLCRVSARRREENEAEERQILEQESEVENE